MAPVRVLDASLRKLADRLGVAVAISLPWSTSASEILIALWLLAYLPTLDPAALRREVATPAGGLPVLLWAFAALGVLWADAPWPERLAGLGSFHRLLLIPLLFAHFRRSGGGPRVIAGFFGSCAVLLALSWASVLWPAVMFWRPGNPGVPFKDQVTQSAEFAMCAFGLGAMAIAAWRASHHGRAVALAAGALAFLGNVALVATSRAELVVVAVLAVLLGTREFGWKGLTSSIVALIVAAGIAWSSAGYLRGRIDHAAWEVRQYVTTNAPTSAGLRLEWLRKSVEFVTAAPIIGHGTGTIAALFRASAIGKSGAAAAVTDNPHNQILTVAIQLGAVGAALLIAMWVAHLTLFRGPAPAAWLGLVVVVQNVVAAPFHSHLLDFTEGWLYIWGVGVIGAIVRGAEPARPFDGKQSLNGDLSPSPGWSP